MTRDRIVQISKEAARRVGDAKPGSRQKNDRKYLARLEQLKEREKVKKSPGSTQRKA